MNIILFGFKSSGKTTLGKLLAQELAYQFIDIDDLIEQLYQNKHNRRLSIREIYNIEGEKIFRALEKEAIKNIEKIDNTVIATGGGSVLDIDNVAKLKQLGKLVYLKIPEEVIKNRIFSEELPPFLTGKNLEQEFTKMYDTRKKVYEKVADIIIEITAEDKKEIIKKIIGKVQHGK